MNQAWNRCGRTQTGPKRQGGVVLVLFALLMVGVFGWLAAIIDVGRLRVTTQQLDAAAESASLEGIRFKDIETDSSRRQRAIDAVARMFDDDLDPAAGDPMGLGAGSQPLVAATGPLGGSISAPGQGYKPAVGMWPNVSNARHGDMVAGAFVAGSGPETEDDLFRRSDFAPAPPDAGTEAFSRAPAFLVRLRRAGSRLGLDRVPDESSAGPPFEWLFARGSAWIEPGSDGAQQSRADGITVRATAIASSERALAVSLDPLRGLGLAPIALSSGSDAVWRQTAAGATVTLQLEPNGTLSLAGREEGLVLATPARAVGTAIETSDASLASFGDSEWIVPVYAMVAGARRIAGFALAAISFTGSEFVIQRRAGAVLPSGASSISAAALDARIALSSSPDLRLAHLAVVEPVLAPVLRR